VGEARLGFEDLHGALRAARRVLLTGPLGPDGDSLGACLALARVLRLEGLAVDVAGDAGFRYAFLPGADRLIHEDRVEPGYDAVVVLDGDRHRLAKPVEAAFEAADVRAIIDHHASTQVDGYSHAWLAPRAASTCEMLYDAFRRHDLPIDADTAALLYVGAIFDTGGFRYSNTTPATHEMAADLIARGFDHAALNARVLQQRRVRGLRLTGEVFATAALLHGGALILGEVTRERCDRLDTSGQDLEGIVDTMVFVDGVEVAAVLHERKRDVKVSFRSRGRVNVAHVAHALDASGGGHFKASGVVLPVDLDAARAAVVEAVGAALTAP
jgi:phosphoesterase RecJ-like protein